MKKKFTHLISCCFAILLLGSGTAWGQDLFYTPSATYGGTYGGSAGFWGTGSCEFPSFTWAIGSTTFPYYGHDDLYIKGERTSTWNYYGTATIGVHTWTVPATPSCSSNSDTYTKYTYTPYEVTASSGSKYWAFRLSTITYGCSCTGTPICSWGWYQSSSNPNAGDTEGNGRGSGGYNNDGHIYISSTTCPEHLDQHTHTHMPVLLNVTGTSGYCAPIHFNIFDWGVPTWKHIKHTYSFNWVSNYPTWTYSSESNSHTGTASDGTIDINSGSVRLHEQMAESATAVSMTHHLTIPANNYNILFDKKYLGLPGSVAYTDGNVIELIQANEGLGLWAGTDQTIQVENGGYLYLGPTHADQSTITVEAATSGLTTTVQNYLCDGGSAPYPMDDKLGTTNHHVAMDLGAYKVGDGTLLITNRNICRADSIMDATFTPIFASGGTGKLEINPLDAGGGGVYFDGNVLLEPAGQNVNFRGSYVEQNDVTSKTFIYEDKSTNGGLTFDIYAGGTCQSCPYIYLGNFQSKEQKTNGTNITIGHNSSEFATAHIGIYKLTHEGKKGNFLVTANDTIGVMDETSIKMDDTNTGDVKFKSTGHIAFGRQQGGKKFEYLQSNNTDASKGLFINTLGDCTYSVCGSGGTDKGAYIWFDGTVTINNENNGKTEIKTAGDSIHMAQTFDYTAGSGTSNLLVQGQTAVGIVGNTVIDYDTKSSTGGYAQILSPRGYIYEEGTFTYKDKDDANKLEMIASGPCIPTGCEQVGFVFLNGMVTTVNGADLSSVLIRSDNSSVTMNTGFSHTGKKGDMIVQGQSGVELLGASNVLITRSDDGDDNILSPKGQIHAEGTFTYNQTSTTDPNGHLLVNASSMYANDCDWGCMNGPNAGLGGYIWLEKTVTTTNKTDGTSTFRSNGEFVRVDQPWIHSAADSSLLIWAQGHCEVGCGVLNSGGGSKMSSTFVDNCLGTNVTVWEEGYLKLPAVPTSNAKEGRPAANQEGGYVWFQDDMTSFAFTGTNKDGDIMIKSDADIVQFDKNLTNKTDVKGSHFLVWGGEGIRTIGAADLGNNKTDYTNVSEAYTRFLSTITPAATRDSMPRTKGNVTFYSPDGFIDFWNTFKYEAVVAADSSSLNINARHRVEFANSATVKMNTGTRGDVNIKAEDGFVNFQNILDFDGSQGDVNIFAKGRDITWRSSLDSAHDCTNNGGFVRFTDKVTIDYTAATDSSKLWIRSDNDDVEISDDFLYTNALKGANNGEVMIQAGQDIFGSNVKGGKQITFTQRGEKAILWEAKKTIHTKQPVLFDRGATAISGNIILKAGYNSFADSANISTYNAIAGGWNLKGDCGLRDYSWRNPCTSMLGADIWFEGNVTTLLGAAADTIQTIMRAYHSIYIDSSFVYTQTGSDVGGNTLLFAETGNIEAIVDNNKIGSGEVVSTSVEFNIPSADNAELRLQAGNQVWNEGDTCSQVTNFSGCWITGRIPGAEFDGNILFNKPLNVNHKGLGFTMLSSARDIENQVLAPIYFDYDNTAITDSVIMTAGRHLETHAKVTFDYTDAGQMIGDPNKETGAFQILMQAGRLDTVSMTCSSALCKANEEGTSLWDGSDAWPINGADNTTLDNFNSFAVGGKGQGSILMFDSVEFNYNGKGAIIMRALNGNIESDPYLHRNDNRVLNTDPLKEGYNGFNNVHNAQLTFNHGGSGITQMKAIDIKLHDKLAYYNIQHANDSNGQFYMTAYDSILTRNIEYVNPTDTGSVFITTAKYKAVVGGCDNQPFDCTNPYGPYAIQQGHIVLGYGADKDKADDELNKNDSIVFNFAGNTNTLGANVYIRAGYEGFTKNKIKGTAKTNLFTSGADRGKGYGGNITFDFMKIDMAKGRHTQGGYLEISTPNGNIWGKDSIYYHGHDGDVLVDAGLGSLDDPDAIRWAGFTCPGGSEKTLNTQVPYTCDDTGEWRTGNIMMKGAYLSFQNDEGHATFRTREGFIDTYDAFTVDSMRGHLLKYAGTNDAKQDNNQWGDVSERDFQYTPVVNSGSVFFGADDNIMMNYGYSNDVRATQRAGVDGYLYEGRGDYDITGAAIDGTPLVESINPYYWTSYKQGIDAYRAIFNVNEDGYMWYRHTEWPRKLHRMYRGCSDLNGSNCSGLTGQCETTDNFARPLTFNFAYDIHNNPIQSGGLGIVATNYIDMFTAFTYYGGDHGGMAAVPGMTTLHGESVSGYGLYMKSLFTADSVESRRATCEGCNEKSSYPIGAKSANDSDASLATTEWTYIGFHDDARIHTNNQKSLLEAPVIEFFGHAELDADFEKGTKTRLTLKGDSLIFHDSAIFDGTALELLPYTTGTPRANDMRYGVINDRGASRKYYQFYGPAIAMEDRETPVLEFGYQRCNEPTNTPFTAPNLRSKGGLESAPKVGGDIIVAFKHDFSLPIYNSVVANHARISFISDSIDHTPGGEYVDACIRTDLLRIRNMVEFYTDPTQPMYRKGVLKMTSDDQMQSVHEAGIYPRHLHLEPGSELSIPGEDSLVVIATTTVGGYGNLHENVFVKANAVIAPGFASLMEGDCQTWFSQGKLTIHNLTMEKDAVFRISISDRNDCYDPETNTYPSCTQTDTLVVQDSIFFNETIPLVVLPETETLDPGCYLFLEYGDTTGVSAEYVKNLKLVRDRYEDYFFTLDFSERGKVYLCVTTTPIVEVRRYVDIPEVAGVVTNPVVGRYFVYGHKDFSFTANFSGTPLKVKAYGYYSKKVKDLDLTAEWVSEGTYLYTIYQVVEPWQVIIGPDPSTVANDGIHNQRVWAHKNTLFINVEAEDIVSIYNMAGVLYKKVEITEGLNKFTLERGVYVVTLKDGSVHKIIIK